MTGATADVDRDGRTDILLTDFDPAQPTRLFQRPPSGHWLDVDVTAAGRGVGTTVEVYAPGQLGRPERFLGAREVTASVGYASGVAPIVHLGLGPVPTVDMRIGLPRNGGVIDRIGVGADQRLVVAG